VKRKKLVLPGKEIASAEEVTAGDGTFEENGKIKASRIGEVHIDETKKIATVQPVTSIPVKVKKGDTVIGEVRDVRNSIIIVDIIQVVGKERSLYGDKTAIIHVSEISMQYVKDPLTEYRAGDIIRAKVIQEYPNLQLSTKGPNLGSIKSLCVKCRYPLKLKGKILECERCGNKETRKMAIDYGQGEI
jgi:exosome complex component CSL4